MLSTTEKKIGICLFELPDKDQAIIQRVITFGASQGKNYSLQPEATDAQIVITLEDTPLPACQAVKIGIGEGNTSEHDLLLQRPLLVTRVMRTIDDAAQLYRSRSTPVGKFTQEEEPSIQAELQSIETPAQSEAESDEAGASHESMPVTEDEQNSATPVNPSEVENDQVGMVETGTQDTEKTSNSTLIVESTIPYQPETVPEEDQQALSTALDLDKEDEDYHHLALVVDDSAAIRKQLEIELRNAHIKADFAETGEEALEKSARKEYDLIFLDIIMPGIDGYEVCRQMRARKSMKKIPIIMLSGKTSPLDEVQGVIAGASTYLTKPVKHEQFQQTLKRVSKWLREFAR